MIFSPQSSRLFLALSILAGVVARAEDLQLKRGRDAIKSQAGCYLVDYNFVETESLQPGYIRDARVYDVNKTKSVKEWIFAEDLAPGRIRLQHVLFAADMNGIVIPGSFLKHQAEDWEYNASYLYDFSAPLNWTVKDLTATPNLWKREITNLDDGLRYQCAAKWLETTAFPEWSCDNYAPIPGRETRDMGRKDYNTLQRSTRLLAYKDSWLERQQNVKTIYDPKTATRTPLAKEVGKTWYVRLADSECREAQAYAQARVAFWTVLRQAWSKVLRGDRAFVEKAPRLPSRYERIMALEDQYIVQDMSDPAKQKSAETDIINVIQTYRAN